MQRFIYFVCVLVVLLNIHCGFSSEIVIDNGVLSLNEGDYNNDNDNNEDTSPVLLSTTTIAVESFVEDIVDNVTESITITTTEITVIDNTTVINEEQSKQFLTEYPLNVNLSSSSLSDLTFHTYSNDSILLVFEDHEIVLINKNDGTIKSYYKYTNIIPTNQPNFLVIYDDNTQELLILNSNHEQKSQISFKPKHIYSFPSINNLWIAETSDETALYISDNAGINWKKIDDTSSSTVLGWSSKANSIVIVQHSRYIKLLDATTHQILPILTDVSVAKLFSRYLFVKRSNINDSVTISHINNLADGGFRSLPKRLQSEGNFYCAIEDKNTQDLLLLFITDKKLEENNETISSSSTCNLISYSKQSSFNLTNISCPLNHNDNLLKSIDCLTEQLPFYQVRGLPKSVYLANIASGPTTVISFDGGINWNKTHYECDKMMNCPNNVSIVISSLISSDDVPGIIVGKASDGTNEYIATSFDSGRLWRLNSKGDNYLTAISNSNALIVSVLNNTQQSSNHTFRYSTDYGRNWHEKTLTNETSFRILSLIADKNNIFYILTSNNDNILNLMELDFNLLIHKQCARHELKEWSLQGSCINGSKYYYKRRISGSHCLDNATDVRIESCACLLSDFECLPGYKRSSDGICLPKSHYISSQDCTCEANTTLSTKRRGYMKSTNSQCRNGIENYLSDTYITRRDLNHPNFFLYGIDSQTKQTTIEIHTNDFNQDDDDEDDDDEDIKRNTIQFADKTYEITALAFDENTKQVYIAVEHDQSAIIYRMNKNHFNQDRITKQFKFDSNNELYKNSSEHIEYLTIDWLTQNLYVLVHDKNTHQQNVFILDIRTHKRRTILNKQHFQPAILLIDPIKTNLYWISHNSPSSLHIANLQGHMKKQSQLFSTDTNISYISYDSITHEIIFVVNSSIYGLNTLDHNRLVPRLIYEHSSYWISHNSPSSLHIANLQGHMKKQSQLFSTDTNISYISYDSITHEIIFVVNSSIYGLNTLDHNRLVPRLIYEHSSNIHNALFVHPILYFTNENNNNNNNTDSSIIHLHAIDILAKSFAKNLAKFKNFDSLKLFIDMAPNMPQTATINRCANNPCSDVCIPLEHGKSRCLCRDDASYPSCSCPTSEKYVTGSCQAVNEQCAPGRSLCQNRINCAESARLCEQDHTQYTEAFKNTARCTLEQPNDGFDCYYNEDNSSNHTCIPFEWLCDGVYDCPFVTHVMCRNKWMKINEVCRILDIRTHKRRTILNKQHFQPAILLIDPIKTNLYWISHNSPSSLHIANLQGHMKKQSQLFSTDTNISYISYDSITHEIIFVVNSSIYGLNTLDHNRLVPRLIYEHSSNIHNALFIHPILYFTNENNNNTDTSIIHLHAIDILAKSFAKNLAKFKNFDSLKLFIDMAPNMPQTATINRCANNPCSDVCIPLEHGKFRCLCRDDASYPSCSCPTSEKYVTGSCQAVNEQCAPGRILCQNRINCAESARLCEQDHTQYTEAFKNTARCTLEQPNDGFDCYYNENNSPNHTCIPFEWLCDGVYDCPFGNDEEHCHKMTTTRKTVTKKTPSLCLTDTKFTHVMCRNKCMKINEVCRTASNKLTCSNAFHLHCKQTNEEDHYDCKCRDNKNRCIAMSEQCDDPDHCERVCKTSIHYAKTKGNQSLKSSSIAWIVLLIAILIILFVTIIIMTMRYKRRKQPPVSSRTPPAETEPSTTNLPPSDTREKLLNSSLNTANETS
ncbi:unnamed protein product [Adineta steineri]|uniref:EGF-like domain-containing protein n=1 Tax=Adineta steineri TaxID=433720 RepID=A0A813URN8_9BILA|nr:unnamed protein product [Adineta steineri]